MSKIKFIFFLFLVSCNSFSYNSKKYSSLENFNGAYVFMIFDDKDIDRSLVSKLSQELTLGDNIEYFTENNFKGFTVNTKNKNGGSTSYFYTYNLLVDKKSKENYFKLLVHNNSLKTFFSKKNNALLYITFKKKYKVVVTRKFNFEKEKEVKEGDGFFDPGEKYAPGFILESAIFDDEMKIENYYNIEAVLYDIQENKIAWTFDAEKIQVDFYNKSEREQQLILAVKKIAAVIKSDGVLNTLN